MGDKAGEKATITSARQQLESLYLGVPDDSVDLTFKDMVSFQQNDVAERKKTSMEPVHEEASKDLTAVTKDMTKSSSLDFSRALHGAKPHDPRTNEDELYRERLARTNVNSDASFFCSLSTVEDRGGRKRPGIPHSNVCALCSEYIYIFRNRCLVCGRVYCRSCLEIGMGQMTEGRKCVDCLGRRFNRRYIQRAGQTECFCRYPSTVKQQELIWAEKGPQRSRGRQYGRSGTEMRPKSPIMMPGTPTRSYAMPKTPNRFLTDNSINYSSFVTNSTFSPNPHNFPL